MSNVNFDTECKMFGKMVKNSLNLFVLLNFILIILCVVSLPLLIYSTLFNLFKYKKLEIAPYVYLPLPKNLVPYLTKLRIVHIRCM